MRRMAMSGDVRTVIGVPDRRRFFSTIVAHLRAALPDQHRRFTHRGDFNLMKIWWDNPRVHFEVVIDQQIDRIEIGLHFEDGPASTIAYLRALDTRVLELKHELGYHVELERWTMSWGRIYELLPIEVDDTSGKRIALRVERFIVALQPIVLTAAVPPERSAKE